jgi:hypothetical protein
MRDLMPLHPRSQRRDLGHPALLTVVVNLWNDLLSYANELYGSTIYQTSSYSDSNVMMAPPIISALVCWFSAPGNCPLIPPPSQNGAMQSMPQQQQYGGNLSKSASFAVAARSSGQISRGIEGRMAVKYHGQGLVFAQPNELILEPNGFVPVKVSTVEKKYSAIKHQMDLLPKSGADEAVTRNADGSFSIQYVPQHLGDIRLRVMGITSDFKVFAEEIDVKVSPPAQSPVSFFVGDISGPEGSFGLHYLTMKRPGGDRLLPNAIYSGQPRVFEVDPSFVTFNVRQQGGNEAILLDPASGKIVPKAPGKALVEADFWAKGPHMFRSC